ncbi:MAG: DUF721 domain-containing protein [Granulosicoccus sp.]|nr:DUF721 domain-containing protein [Granulosicoccus sp.]
MKSFHHLIDTATRAAMQQDRRMKEVISRIVPAATLSHIQFCRLEAGRLRITVDNAAWVAKLRFCERQLTGALRAESLDVHTVSFHVAPVEVPVVRTTLRKTNTVSPRAAMAVAALAESMTESTAESTAETSGQGSTPPGRPGRTRGDVADERSVVRGSGDRLRQELLKLAAKLRES